MDTPEPTDEPRSNPPLVPVPYAHVRPLARIVFTVFLLTFIVSRVVVILIMAHKMPAGFFLHLGGTHVHHLNYGIFLLCTVAGIMLFFQLSERERGWFAVAYGFSLALTFDEFGMWLHLGGGYWQRASFDGVIVVASLLGLLAFFPPLARMRAHHWITGIVTILATIFFYILLFKSLDFAGNRYGASFQQLEESGPQ
jgi:hypothetical protein